MKYFFTLLLLIFSQFLNGQAQIDNNWSKKYINEDWEANMVTSLIDTVKFKPALKYKNESIVHFKAALLSLPSNSFELLSRSGWFLCSTKHQDYFQLWNLFYTPISQVKWDKYCRGLIILMLIDETASTK